MCLVASRAKYLSQSIDRYGREQEQWKEEHNMAELCFALREFATDAINDYERICRLDEYWFLESLSSFNKEDFDTTVRELFEAWHSYSVVTLRIFSGIKSDYVDRGFDVNPFSQLEALNAECTALLNPQDVETDLADIALAQYHQGETLELIEM